MLSSQELRVLGVLKISPRLQQSVNYLVLLLSQQGVGEARREHSDTFAYVEEKELESEPENLCNTQPLLSLP